MLSMNENERDFRGQYRMIRLFDPVMPEWYNEADICSLAPGDRK